MTAVASMPGNWFRGDEMNEEYSNPKSAGQTIEILEPPHLLISSYVPYTSAHQELSASNLQLPTRENIQQNQMDVPNTTSPITPHELFIPEFDIPRRHNLRASRNSQQSPAITTAGKRTTPRLSLQVDALTMSSSAPRIPSSIRPGKPSFWQADSTSDMTSNKDDRPNRFRSSSNVQDELFFKSSPSPFSMSSLRYGGVAGPSATQLSATKHNIEDTEWRRYEPPMELLRPANGTSIIIESLLESSINRLKERHEQREGEVTEGHISQEKREIEASQVQEAQLPEDIATVDEQRLKSTTNDLQTTSEESQSPSTRISNDAPSPDDSGYGSTSPVTGEPSSPSSSSPSRMFGGLSSIFKRSKNSSKQSVGSLTSTWTLSQHSTTARRTDPNRPGSSTFFNHIVECVSCRDDFRLIDVVKLSCHSYCGDCFIRLVNNALESESQWPAKCCSNLISSDTIINNVNGPTKKLFRDRNAEWSVPVADRLYCPQPKCSKWIPPKNISHRSQSAKCAHCSFKMCRMCRGPFHGNKECPSDDSTRATFALAESEGWKKCFSCHALVERKSGCREMICRCRARFCYDCGFKWRKCGCSIVDGRDVDIWQIDPETERTLQDMRLVQRARREAIEDAATAAAVTEYNRAIHEANGGFEAYVSQEAEEQPQQEENILLSTRAGSTKGENTQISSSNPRYWLLVTELDRLHDVQRVSILERHEFSGDVVKRDRQNALNVLGIRHPADIEALEKESKTRITAAENQLASEHQSRRAAEKRIENDDMLKLAELWDGEPDSEDKLHNAQELFRKRQASHHIFWVSYQKEKLDTIRLAESEKRDSLNARHLREVKQVHQKAKSDELAWNRRCWAEKKWIDAVVEERFTMLRELGQEEDARAENSP